MIKCTAVCVFSSLVALMLRRYHPELSFALSAATLSVILLCCGVLLDRMMDGVREIGHIFGSDLVQLKPILKCLGIAAISKIGADLCRDASQIALANAVELIGSLCAMAISLPMILSMLALVGGLL